MPKARIRQALRNKEALCVPCMIHKDPTTITSVFGLPQVLTRLLEAKTFTLGQGADRRYGGIEPLLEPYRKNE